MPVKLSSLLKSFSVRLLPMGSGVLKKVLRLVIFGRKYALPPLEARLHGKTVTSILGTEASGQNSTSSGKHDMDAKDSPPLRSPMEWSAKLKKEIRLSSVVFQANKIVTLTRHPARGYVHVKGYESATVADQDWELVMRDTSPWPNDKA